MLHLSVQALVIVYFAGWSRLREIGTLGDLREANMVAGIAFRALPLQVRLIHDEDSGFLAARLTFMLVIDVLLTFAHPNLRDSHSQSPKA